MLLRARAEGFHQLLSSGFRRQAFVGVEVTFDDFVNLLRLDFLKSRELDDDLLESLVKLVRRHFRQALDEISELLLDIWRQSVVVQNYKKKFQLIFWSKWAATQTYC